MYIGDRQYSATVFTYRDVLVKLDELDAMLREAPIDLGDWERFDAHIRNLRKGLQAQLRDAEMGLWEQNGYPTMARGR